MKSSVLCERKHCINGRLRTQIMRSFVDELPVQLKSDIIRISEENDGAFKVFQQLYTHLTKDDDFKRRRVEDATSTKIVPSTVLFQLKELSFQSPIRKKLSLTLFISPSTQKPMLSIGKGDDDAPDLVIDDLSPSNITLATLLPVAEKKNMLYFVIFYRQSSSATTDPVVFMMNKESVTKQLVLDGKLKEGNELTQFLIRQCSIIGMKLFEFPTESFYVESHRGTKEGLLYFLPKHLLFGFKKPILLFASEDIESISYSSITRITFTLTLTLKDQQVYEFSMIDQQEFAQIDAYVKNRAVQDMSMSEALKEKVKNTKNQQSEGALLEALQEDIQQSEDDEEDDGDYQVGKEVDDTSDVSGEEDDDEDGDVSGDDDDISDDEEDLSGDAEIDLNSDDD